MYIRVQIRVVNEDPTQTLVDFRCRHGCRGGNLPPCMSGIGAAAPLSSTEPCIGLHRRGSTDLVSSPPPYAYPPDLVEDFENSVF